MDSISFLLQRALADIPDKARDWLAVAFIPALLIIVIGIIAAKLVRRSLRALLNKTRIRTDPLLTSFFLRAIYSIILILSLITALKKAGVPIETFIAGAGITGIIIGFGLRDTLANLAAGLFLLIYRPFRAGETIEVEGSKGIVQELTIVNMQMTTTDGVRVIMPNSKVWGSKITNFSMSEHRRVDITIRVKKRDAGRAIEIIQRALNEDTRILQHPPANISISSLAENAATLTISAWTKPADFQTVTDDQYMKVSMVLEQAEIETV